MSCDEWRCIPGFPECFQVSSSGGVRRRTAHGFRVLSKRRNTWSYLVVTLSFEGKHVNKLVHRLVAAAFLGPLPDGLVVNHKDQNRMNNTVDNLEYVTQQENIVQAYRKSDRKPGGARIRLSEDDVNAIRSSTEAREVLARRYGVSVVHIRQVQRLKAWAFVPVGPGYRVDPPKRGRYSGRHRLSEEELVDIRSSGRSVRELADQYHLSRSTIYSIRNGSQRSIS